MIQTDSMRYLHIDADRNLTIREKPVPKITDPDEILIKISYASICNYDLMTLRGEASYSSDHTIGHEASGIVVDAGPNVVHPSLQPGNPVTMEVYNHCLLCDECRKGNLKYCTNPREMNGFFMSEYAVMSQQHVYALPGMEYLKSGCLTEPLVMAMYTVEKANLKEGSSVIILGGGAMGQIILQTVMLHPVSTVVVVDPNENKRALALKSGADFAISTDHLFVSAMELTNSRGFDAVIEASGNPIAAKTAFSLVARGGAVVFFSIYQMGTDISFDSFQLYWKDASVHGVCVPSNTFIQAVQMLPKLHLEDAVTGTFPFSRAIEAFSEKINGKHAKVMLEF